MKIARVLVLLLLPATALAQGISVSQKVEPGTNDLILINFLGSDISAKMAAAIAQCPAGGCRIVGTGLDTGTLNFAAKVTVNKPARIELPPNVALNCPAADSCISIESSGAAVIGDGMHPTRLNISAAGKAAIEAPTAGLRAVEISDIEIYATGSASGCLKVGSTSAAFADANFREQWTIDRVSCRWDAASPAPAGSVGVSLTQVANADVRVMVTCYGGANCWSKGVLFDRTTVTKASRIRSQATEYVLDVQQSDPASACTNATNASPIVLTCASHGLSTGNVVRTRTFVGNTAANGRFTITVVDPNTLSLNGSTGNGAYVSGGTVAKYITGGDNSSIDYVDLGIQAAGGVGIRLDAQEFSFQRGFIESRDGIAAGTFIQVDANGPRSSFSDIHFAGDTQPTQQISLEAGHWGIVFTRVISQWSAAPISAGAPASGTRAIFRDCSPELNFAVERDIAAYALIAGPITYNAEARWLLRGPIDDFINITSAGTAYIELSSNFSGQTWRLDSTDNDNFYLRDGSLANRIMADPTGVTIGGLAAAVNKLDVAGPIGIWSGSYLATISATGLTAARGYTLSNATGYLPSLPSAATTETGTAAVVRATEPTITRPLMYSAAAAGESAFFSDATNSSLRISHNTGARVILSDGGSTPFLVLDSTGMCVKCGSTAAATALQVVGSIAVGDSTTARTTMDSDATTGRLITWPDAAGYPIVLSTSVTNGTGTGNVVLDTSPTIVTPTIASLVNMNHGHADAAGGGTINYSGVGSCGGSPQQYVFSVNAAAGPGCSNPLSGGLSATKTVRAAGGAADCTLVYTNGLLTGGTC